MTVNNPKPSSPEALNNKRLNDFQWGAEAYRNFLVDSTGSGVSGSNPLPTESFNNGYESTTNTFEETLAIDEVRTGEWEDTLNYNNIIIGVKSTQNSATNGLAVQWSHDGTHVDDDDVFTISANTGKVFTFCPARRYFRIVYTNDGVEADVYLQTVMKKGGIKASSHRIQDNIVAEDDAELVKSVLTGKDDNGVFNNVKTDFGGLLRVNSFPYTYSIAEGDILGHTALLKFGTRTSTTTAESTIWEGTAVRYPYIPTATQLSVVSTSSSDSSAGTGIRTLTLHGLVDNAGSWDEDTETITLTGTTPVLTTKSFIRIFRAYGTTSGTTETNVGTINVTAAGVQVLVINPSDGQTLMALWTVPSGKTAYITNGSFSTNSNKGSIVSLYARLNDGITYPWRIQYRAYIFSGNENFPFTIPFKIPEKTDIEIRTTQASVGADCGATFELWYEDN